MSLFARSTYSPGPVVWPRRFVNLAASVGHEFLADDRVNQNAEDFLDIVAPNEKFVREALNVGHNMTVRVLYEFNLVGQLGLDEINAAGKKMVAVWKALQKRQKR
jgi:hypothetical protein